MQIKYAIESISSLDNISDFQCAQLALVFGANIDQAVETAENMQHFRELYQIKDTIKDAAYSFCRLFKLAPGHVMYLSYSSLTDSYLACFDAKAFKDTAFKTDQDYKDWQAGSYYLFQAMSPDLASIRKGVTMMYECDGYDYPGMHPRTSQRLCQEMYGVYPLQFHKIKFFHSGMFLNLLLAACKPFLPTRVTSKHEVGCTLAHDKKNRDTRLSELFLQPNVEVAEQNTLTKAILYIKRRVEMEASFSL